MSDSPSEGKPASPSGARAVGSDQLTLAGVLVGTPRYMAPEQLEGLPADAASDQFSFCVVAWEALTGRPPFAATTVDGLRAAIRSRSFDESAAGSHSARPPALRAALALLERGLHHDASRRWASMTELLAGLSLALARPKPRRKSSRRSIASAMLIGALGAVAIVVGVPVGADLAPASRAVAASAARSSARAAAAAVAEPGRPWQMTTAVTGSTAPSEATRGADEDPGAPGHDAEAKVERNVAPATTITSGSGVASPAAKVEVGEGKGQQRDVCHLHEDTYELLERGSRKRTLTHADGCFECRIERRRSRTSRFSPAGCGAYALCAPRSDAQCG